MNPNITVHLDVGTKLGKRALFKLWKEFDNFEIGINRATGRKNMQEQSPHYMTARSAKTQMDQKLEGLDRTSLPKLPPIYGCDGEAPFPPEDEIAEDPLENTGEGEDAESPSIDEQLQRIQAAMEDFDFQEVDDDWGVNVYLKAVTTLYDLLGGHSSGDSGSESDA